MTDVSIGVDIGSTSIKAIALDNETKQVLEVVSTPLDSRIPGLPVGRYEEDPLRIKELAFALIRELATKYADRIAGIAFTGQMHSGFFIDRELRPITNLVTWQDKRGDERSASGVTYAEILREDTGPDPTGVGIHSGFLAVTAHWHIQNGLRLPNGAKLIGIYDWLTSLLVRRPVTDVTSAAAWGIYDVVAGDWKKSPLSQLSLSNDALPEVYEPGACIGNIQSAVAQELSLPAATKIYASIGDTQASFIGAGVEDSELLLNFGTGSQSMWLTNNLLATSGTDIRYLRNGRYIGTAPTMAGGKAYQLLADFYASVLLAFDGRLPERTEIYERLNRLALESGSDGVSFDPIFSGNRWREPRERASISGLDAANFHVGPVTRALLEGMIEEVAAPYFLREGENTPTGLVGAGNGMRRNAALRDVAQKRFGLPLRLAEFEEEAARGAALLTIT